MDDKLVCGQEFIIFRSRLGDTGPCDQTLLLFHHGGQHRLAVFFIEDSNVAANMMLSSPEKDPAQSTPEKNTGPR